MEASMLKIVIIVVLLLVAVHLLLYGYLQRRIDAAKREKDQQNDG
jgi:nitric oxide reductase large subunit